MDFRTLVRVFLVVGGVAFAVAGALEGSTLDVGFGALAALLGAFGLWWDRRESAEE